MEKCRIIGINKAKNSVNSDIQISAGGTPLKEANGRGDEWSIKIFNCSQNFTFARFARKI